MIMFYCFFADLAALEKRLSFLHEGSASLHIVLTLTRCRTVDLVLLCDFVDRPMLTDSRRERCLPDGK